jgi:hypothetical protein
MTNRSIGGLLVAAVVLLFARAAAAQEPEGPGAFGDVGHFVLSGERLFGYVHTSVSESQGGTSVDGSADSIAVLGSPGANNEYSVPRLGFDFFVTQGLSLGGSIAYLHLSQEIASSSASGWTVLVAPRIGYALAAGPTASIWLRAGGTYRHADSSGTTLNLYALTLEAPVVIRVGAHAALSIGPTVDIGLGGSTSSGSTNIDTKATEFGLQAGLLLYL